MTANMIVAFQVHLFNAGTEATTWSTANMDRVLKKLETECYGIISNVHKQCKKELSSH